TDLTGTSWATEFGTFTGDATGFIDAPLGFGTSTETPTLVGALPDPAGSNVPTYYLRYQVNLTRPVIVADFTRRIDDGYILFVNGVEVDRFHCEPGEEAHASFCSGVPTGWEFDDETDELRALDLSVVNFFVVG